jgi:hypothetical protein
MVVCDCRFPCCDLEAERRATHGDKNDCGAAPSCWQCWSCCWLLNLPMIDSSVGWEMAVHELCLVCREGGMMPSLRIELWEVRAKRWKMSVQICQMIRGVLSGMKNIYFIRYFVQSIDLNYPVLNTRICGAGLLWVVFAHRCLTHFFYVDTYQFLRGWLWTIQRFYSFIGGMNEALFGSPGEAGELDLSSLYSLLGAY